MFSGEATPNLKLPQWQPKDHPDFLTDINDAFKAIDTRAGSDTEEWGQLPTQVSNLTDIVTSLNEDRTTMIGEIEAINVALGNLRTESAKIEPIQKQVLGLQEIAKRQSDAIQKINVIQSTRVWSGSVPIDINGVTVTLTVVRRDGNIITLVLNNVLNAFKTLNLGASEFSSTVDECSNILESLGITYTSGSVGITRTLFLASGIIIGWCGMILKQDKIFLQFQRYTEDEPLNAERYPQVVIVEFNKEG